MTRVTRFLRGTGGFTLAEILVVIAILGFIMGAVFTLQHQGQLAYLTGSARVEVQQNARVGLDALMSDLRFALPQAGTTRVVTAIDNACATGPAPTNGGGVSIGFTAQREPDVAHDPVNYHGHSVTYQVNGTNLERTENGVTDVVIGGVQQLQIWCYNGSGALSSVLTEIREIRIQIRTQTQLSVAAGSPGDQHVVAEGRVRFRNI
jgi:prepilin-type N-terminal cleavage/methylation domain-containing protein